MHNRVLAVIALTLLTTGALGAPGLLATGDAPARADVAAPATTAKPPVNPPTDAYKVLVLVADGNGANIAQTLQDSSGGTFTTTFINASSWFFRRPDSLLALGYRAVLTYTNSTYMNRVAFGDTLAKFVDLGGGAVVMIFANYSSYAIGGRYESQYLPVPLDASPYLAGTLGTVHLPSHPIMNGVTAVGVHSYGSSVTTVRHAPYGYRIADWSGGSRVQCAAFDSSGRRTAFLGFFGSTFYYGTTTGQWVRQMVNALQWVSISFDVGVSHIVAPAGLIDSGASVTPACSVYNYGNQTMSCWAKMRIGLSYVDSVQVTDLAPAAAQHLAFQSWTMPQRGFVTVSCSTIAANDNNPANDRLLDSCYGRVIDVGAAALVNPVPGDSLPLDTVLVPAGMWRNYGSTAADFEAWLLLEAPVSGRVYAQKVDVAGLAAGDSVVVASFPACTLAAAGNWTAVCSTGLAGDVTPSNNQRADGFFIFAPDVGVAAITWPVGSVPVNRDVYPGVRVKNYGSRAVVCGVRFVIEGGAGPVYDSVQTGIGLAIGDSATFNFTTPWRAGPLGPYTARAWTVTAFDADPTNDSARAMFQVGTGGGGNWVEVGQVPLTPSGKLVKDGGAMGWDAGLGRAFVLKGYKTGDFYAWDPVGGTWTTLEPIPLGVENKGPYKGANLCSDGNGAFYATKGNNTSGFWKYAADDSLGTWTQLADVPLGLSNKKVKGGTDLVYVEDDTTGWVYLLKGYKTEFYRYNVNAGTWQTLADAPAGVKNKYDKGSWLTYDAAGRKLYAHKAKYSELYAYSLDSMSWGPIIPGMPLANGQTGKSKKSKDGGDAVLLEGVVYGLKGGNTQDFYSLDLATMTWTEEDTIPAIGTTGKKKRVKAGGAITTDGTVLYALKGNKTAEVWRYTPTGPAPMAAGLHVARTGSQGEAGSLGADYRLQVERNPSRGLAVLRWQLPAGTRHSTLSVYDASGRCVHRAVLSGRAGSLQLRGLAAGVYLAKLTSADQTTSSKLVVQH
ncbi:MAG: T9SS type A sorting domain-containing protein [bacterium]